MQLRLKEVRGLRRILTRGKTIEDAFKPHLVVPSHSFAIARPPTQSRQGYVTKQKELKDQESLLAKIERVCGAHCARWAM